MPFSPKGAALGSCKVRLTKTVYIDRADFRVEDSKGYFRLAPRKTIGLLHAPFVVKAVSYSTDDATGLVTKVEAIIDTETKPKAYVQWVPEEASRVEARICRPLFKSEDHQWLKAVS